MTVLLSSYYAANVDPLDSKFAPILAYGMPYIIILNLIWIPILLLFKFWKISLINLVVVLLGFSSITSIYAFGNSEEIQEGDLKIVSYNVRAFDLGLSFDLPLNQIRDSIFEYLSEQDADIYCFQEYYHETRKRQFVTVEKILEATHTKYHIGVPYSDIHGVKTSGVFIYSKSPIIGGGKVETSFESSDVGKCVYADIQLSDNQIIRVYNFHLASIGYHEDEYIFVENLSPTVDINEENKKTGIRVLKMFVNAAKRRSQDLKFVIEHASNSPYPTVLCGDLNDTPSSFAYKQFRKQYNDAFTQAGKGFGQTYSGRMPSNRIDYIFHSDEFKAVDFNIQKEVLSDHLAICAVLRKVK